VDSLLHQLHLLCLVLSQLHHPLGNLYSSLVPNLAQQQLVLLHPMLRVRLLLQVVALSFLVEISLLVLEGKGVVESL
jgi:hypothetical protein